MIIENEHKMHAMGWDGKSSQGPSDLGLIWSAAVLLSGSISVITEPSVDRCAGEIRWPRRLISTARPISSLGPTDRCHNPPILVLVGSERDKMT